MHYTAHLHHISHLSHPSTPSFCPRLYYATTTTKSRIPHETTKTQAVISPYPARMFHPHASTTHHSQKSGSLSDTLSYAHTLFPPLFPAKFHTLRLIFRHAITLTPSTLGRYRPPTFPLFSLSLRHHALPTLHNTHNLTNRGQAGNLAKATPLIGAHKLSPHSQISTRYHANTQCRKSLCPLISSPNLSLPALLRGNLHNHHEPLFQGHSISRTTIRGLMPHTPTTRRHLTSTPDLLLRRHDYYTHALSRPPQPHNHKSPQITEISTNSVFISSQQIPRTRRHLRQIPRTWPLAPWVSLTSRFIPRTPSRMPQKTGAVQEI